MGNMTDAQMVTLAVAILAVFAGTLFNNSRIGDMNSRIGDINKRIDDLRDDVNRHIDDKFKLLDQKLDLILTKIDAHDKEIAYLMDKSK